MLKRRQGFTLIELLIVIVIIGILAAIAIPKFSKTREKAMVKAMVSDLRNLQTQEELWFSNPANNYLYWGGQTCTDAAGSPCLGDGTIEYATSKGVTVAVALLEAGKGFSGSASHSGTDVTCDVYVANTAQTVGSATVSGKIACSDEVAP